MRSLSVIKIFSLLFSLFLYNCSSAGDGPTKVIITTDYGDIEMELYDKTPQHRDNFIKLVKDGYYDGTLFHRVIKDFMIQGGDPDTKNAKPGTRLGNGGPGYTVPAEFVPEYIHKRGAVAAARQGDNINPEKASSGSQFYIVQGRIFTDEQLNQEEIKTAQNKAGQMYSQYLKEEEEALKKEGKAVNLEEIQEKAAQKASEYLANNPYHMKAEDREVYKTIGGTPHLDGEYTVFGFVTKGMEVVDKIAKAETDNANRPKTDVKIKRMKIK